MFDDVDWDRLAELLRPAKIVFGKDLLELKMTGKERREKLSSDLAEALGALEDEFAGRLERDIVERHKSEIALAQLMLATTARVLGEDGEVTGLFTEVELRLYEDFERFSRFDMLSVDEAVREAAKKGTLYDLVKRFYRQQYDDMDALLDNREIRRDLKLAFKERYGERQHKVEAVLKGFIETYGPLDLLAAIEQDDAMTPEAFGNIWYSANLPGSSLSTSYRIGVEAAAESVKTSLANMKLVGEESSENLWHGLFAAKQRDTGKHVLANIQIAGSGSDSSVTVEVRTENPDIHSGFLREIHESIGSQMRKVQDFSIAE